MGDVPVEVPDDCGEQFTVNVDTELLPPVQGHDCEDADAGLGTPVVHVGVVDARIACAVPGFELDVNVVGGTISIDTISGEVEIKNDVDNPIPVTDQTPAVERKVDGDIQVGVGSIVIPDGVISFAVSVLDGGTDPTVLADWPTINGPDFAAPVPLRRGQSVSHGADDGHGNTVNGPITVTVPAGAAVNATWVKP